MPSHSASKEAHYKASYKYEKANTVQMAIRLNKKTDADVIAWMDSRDNKRAYILNLIREDIKSSKKN